MPKIDINLWELTFEQFAKAVRCQIIEKYNTGMQWKYHNYKTIRKTYLVTIDELNLSLPKKNTTQRKTFRGETSYEAKSKAYEFITQKANELF